MAENSKIQWTHATFNMWRGCVKVSPGCTNCYAEAMSRRNPAVLGEWGAGGTRVVAAESYWRQPLAWDRAAAKAGERRRVFCASLADVFEEWNGRVVGADGRRLSKVSECEFVPTDMKIGRDIVTLADVRRRLARLITDTPNLDWLLLTKRPENARQMLYEMWFADAQWPRNYWVGTTVENQEYADRRIPELLKVPAAVRFLSVEPMLGPVNIPPGFNGPRRMGDGSLHHWAQPFIDWVIVGGESGSKARPFDLAWARSIRDQCKAAEVAFFCKQMGSAWARDRAAALKIERETILDSDAPEWAGFPARVDSHGGDWDQWPDDLRVRQMPAPAVAEPRIMTDAIAKETH